MPDPPSPAVLLTVFNRPQVTALAIERLREVAPPVVFVAADGPRPEVGDDQRRCEHTRALVDGIDWPCELVRLEHDTNLGLQRAMVTALDWFFNSVEAGVVLEDDCLCDPSFFRLARYVLDAYADDPTVAYLTAVNLAPKRQFTDASYFFASGGHIWGWATWRRAWQAHDPSLSHWSDQRDAVLALRTPLAAPIVRKADEQVGGGKATWARAWHASVLASGARVAVPSVNLVRNVGLGPGATHTTSPRHALARLSVGEVRGDLRPPTTVEPSRAYDELLARYHTPTLRRRLRRRLRSVVPRR